MGSVCRMRPTSLTPDLSHSGGARACSEEPARTCWLSPLLGETVSGCLLLAFGHERLQEARHCCDFCNCGEILSTLVTSTVLSAQFCRAATTTVPRALSSTPKPCLHCGEAPPASSQASASCPCGPGTCNLTPGLARAGPAVPGSFLSVPQPQACSGGFSVQSSESWFSRWLPVKKRTEAYLPDDKNKSIVWDEKKNRWVDVNEPEEEKKAPPPPPAALPKAPQAAHPGPGGLPRPTVNMYSRKAAGTRARYVDVLNPGGPQRSEPALAPTDLFAPLAPLPIPAHLLGPNADAEELPSTEGASREGPARPEPASDPKVFGPAVASLPGPELPASGLDGPQGGEAPGALAPAGAPSGAAVPFYNPAQFAQAPAASGSPRTGRIGQRKYPALS